MRSLHRSSWSAPTLVGALGLLLAACSGDPSTAATNPPHAPRFTVTPDGGHAASMASFSTHRTWPTIPRRPTYATAAAVPSAGVSAAIINSPFDLTPHGGPVVTGATNWNLYMNCNGSSVSCWGSNSLSPSDFLKDLNRSRFIGILDQYLGRRAYGQFGFDSLEGTYQAIIDNGNLATQDDIFNILLSAVGVTGQSGLGAMYLVFLPAGTDMCLPGGRCYSPDIPNTFFFCAFHGAVLFNNTTLVIYSVEPYQYVDGCRNPVSSPHGVIDATASTLSHEFFEAASDPEIDAWYNVLTGQEVADLCFVYEYNEFVGSHRYQIQSEYSNAIHNCTDATK